MKRIKEVLSGIYDNHELRRSIVPLFISNPGLGKSRIITDFAEEKGVKIVELITSQMSPFEISGICIPAHETQKMVYYNFDRLDDLKDGDILFFDELLNGNPTVLNACLTVLEQRTMISGKKLPNIMICAAANPQGMVPLTPQIKERFVWYELAFDAKMWIEYMIKKYDITYDIGTKLANLINRESFQNKNFNTPRSLDKAVNMIIHDIDTPYGSSVKPILNTLITNTSTETVFHNGKEILLPNESKPWLEIIKLKRNETT